MEDLLNEWNLDAYFKVLSGVYLQAHYIVVVVVAKHPPPVHVRPVHHVC